HRAQEERGDRDRDERDLEDVAQLAVDHDFGRGRIGGERACVTDPVAGREGPRDLVLGERDQALPVTRAVLVHEQPHLRYPMRRIEQRVEVLCAAGEGVEEEVLRRERTAARQLARIRPVGVHGEVHAAEEVHIGERLPDLGLRLEAPLEPVDGAQDRGLLEAALAHASTSRTSVLVPAKRRLIAASSTRTCSPARNSRLWLMSTRMRVARSAEHATTSAAPAKSQRRAGPEAMRPEARRNASSQGWAAASRSRSRRRGAGKQARTAGMTLSSIASADRMPNPVKIPKVRMLAVRKVAREQKESAAIIPAASMTGPTRASDRVMAPSTSPMRSNSS